MRKINNIIQLLTVIVIFSCCKNNNNDSPNLFKDKLKSISCIDFLMDSISFTIDYDSSTLKLSRVYNDGELYFQINRRTNEFVEFEYKKSLGFEPLPANSNLRVRVFFNQNNFVSRIATIDTFSLVETDIALFYSTGSLPDSVRGTNTPFYTNVIVKNFIISDKNITSYNYSFYNLLGGYESNLQTNFTHTTLLTSKNWLPFQNNYGLPYSLSFSPLGFDPIFFLGLDGIFPFNPNKNLISKLQVDNGSSTIGGNNYNYVLNSAGFVEGMSILALPSNTKLECKFEYY